MNSKINRYKRSNKTEQQVLVSLIQQNPKLIIFDKLNTKTIVQQRIEQTSGKIRLFLDAETNNLTNKGNYRKIEFLIVDAKNNFHWLDAKHANTSTSFTDLHGEYYRAKNNTGKVSFITDGNGFNDNEIKSHNEFIKNTLHVNDKIKIIPLSEIKELIKTFKF